MVILFRESPLDRDVTTNSFDAYFGNNQTHVIFEVTPMKDFPGFFKVTTYMKDFLPVLSLDHPCIPLEKLQPHFTLSIHSRPSVHFFLQKCNPLAKQPLFF